MEATNSAGIALPLDGPGGSGQMPARVTRSERWGPLRVQNETPVMFPVFSPVAPATQLQPTPVHPSVLPMPAEAARINGGRTVGTSENPAGADGLEEVIKLSIPVPKLRLPDDLKPRESGKNVYDTTRAYVRDVRKYLQLVRGGDRDAVRCLFVGSTLEGAAKIWYDQWTLARENFTFDELVTALLARFAPEVQPRDKEARNALASGKYRMRSGELVPAYQSRFEALITPIANLTEDDRMFWFQRGLSEDLVGECATDLEGREFRSYAELVQFARGVELRFLAKREAIRPAPRVYALCVQDPNPSDPEAGELVGSGVAPEVLRCTAVEARTGRYRTVRESSGAGTSKGSGSGRGADPKRSKRRSGTPSVAAVQQAETRGKRQREDTWLEKWECTRAELERRKRMRLCQRCAATHPTRDCPLLPPLPEKKK